MSKTRPGWARGFRSVCRQGCGGLAREGWATADSVAGGVRSVPRVHDRARLWRASWGAASGRGAEGWGRGSAVSGAEGQVVSGAGDGVVQPGVADVDEESCFGSVRGDPFEGIALVESGVRRFAVLAESLEAAAGGCVGRNLPEVFGAVEALLSCGGVNLAVVLGLVDPNPYFVLFGAAGDGDVVVEAGPLALSVFEFLDGERGVVGLSVDGDAAFADPGLGDV